MKRLVWLDIAKGLAILWVVYFHFFKTCREWPPNPMSGHFIAEVAGEHGWDNATAAIQTVANIVWYAISGVGFHAVGLFIIVSGWSLASATARREAKGPIAWGPWYRARFIRLYPMYWLAHLVYLVSPFVARLEPIDWRFLISLTGLRMIDIDMNFMYLNAAWWYFSMLIQLYLMFPLLYMGMRKLGLVSFLLLAFAVGFCTRYLLLEVWHASGGWILGGNALSRLPEFALGMVVGMLHLREPERIERWLLGGASLALGLVLYYFAPYFYTQFHSLRSRGFVDGHVLFPMRRRRLGTAGKMVRRGEMARAGRRIFVWHLPRASAVCDLGGTSDQGPAPLGIFCNHRGGPDRAQRVGNRPREIRKRHARENNRRQEKAGVEKPA